MYHSTECPPTTSFSLAELKRFYFILAKICSKLTTQRMRLQLEHPCQHIDSFDSVLTRKKFDAILGCHIRETLLKLLTVLKLLKTITTRIQLVGKMPLENVALDRMLCCHREKQHLCFLPTLQKKNSCRCFRATFFQPNSRTYTATCIVSVDKKEAAFAFGTFSSKCSCVF